MGCGILEPDRGRRPGHGRHNEADRWYQMAIDVSVARTGLRSLARDLALFNHTSLRKLREVLLHS